MPTLIHQYNWKIGKNWTELAYLKRKLKTNKHRMNKQQIKELEESIKEIYKNSKKFFR